MARDRRSRAIVPETRENQDLPAQPNNAKNTPAATADPITPATFGPMHTVTMARNMLAKP